MILWLTFSSLPQHNLPIISFFSFLRHYFVPLSKEIQFLYRGILFLAMSTLLNVKCLSLLITIIFASQWSFPFHQQFSPSTYHIYIYIYIYEQRGRGKADRMRELERHIERDLLYFIIKHILMRSYWPAVRTLTSIPPFCISFLRGRWPWIFVETAETAE